MEGGEREGENEKGEGTRKESVRWYSSSWWPSLDTPRDLKLGDPRKFVLLDLRISFWKVVIIISLTELFFFSSYENKFNGYDSRIVYQSTSYAFAREQWWMVFCCIVCFNRCLYILANDSLFVNHRIVIFFQQILLLRYRYYICI